MNRASRLSSGGNSININEDKRLSNPSVHGFGGGSSRGSLTMDHGTSRFSQPDVRRYMLRHDASGKRERLSQPTLTSGNHQSVRGLQRLSQPCLSTGKEPNSPTLVFQSPSPPPMKHKRFSPSIHASQRDRQQLDIGAKYRNLKDPSSSKYNRDRFSIPELKTQNDLGLLATPKQRFSLDSQLTRNQDSARSRLLPIASSPISEHQQIKIEEPSAIAGVKKSPTREGLGCVLIASTTPILPPGERQFLSPDFALGKKSPTTSKQQHQQQQQKTASKKRSVSPVATRERMSVPEIRNSSLRRLLDPPTRQRHSITGNLRQSICSPGIRPLELGKKSPKELFEEALERFKKDEKEENRRNEVVSNRPNDEYCLNVTEGPKHIQKHYSYTYETTDESSSILGKLSVSAIPKKKYLESNFDENEQVITTVIETDVPMITASPSRYVKKYSYSTETPKWIRKYLENESPKVGRKTIKDQASRRNSRRKNSLESLDTEKITDKVRSKSACASERGRMAKTTGIQAEAKTMKNTYVRIVPSNKTHENNKYEVGVESNWADGSTLYADDGDDSDTETTSI